MRRRALVALGGLLLLTSAGCRVHLAESSSFSGFEKHAERLDYEFGRLHRDVQDIVFGIKPPQEPRPWKVYD